MAVATKTNLSELSFATLRDYLADAVADPRKARVVLEEAEQGFLFEHFEGSERHLLSELYTDVFAHHARLL
ncbi:hypothetical protein BH24DEI2_BH24DEI2_08470 [soil metagenome]